MVFSIVVAPNTMVLTGMIKWNVDARNFGDCIILICSHI